MICPVCQRPTRVLESRPADGGEVTRRRRECPSCGHRFTTFERRDAPALRVRKRDGERQRFDRNKLRAALLRSTHKRQSLVGRIEFAIEAAGGELPAERIGELALEGLGELDHGAYLQFLGTLPSPNTDFAESVGGGSVRAARESSSLPAQTG